MTEQQLRAFVDKINSDPALAKKVNAAADAEAYVAVAEEAGFMLSVDDLELSKSEVSDSELEGLSDLSTTYPSQKCRCP